MSHSFLLGLCDLQAGCLHSKCHVESRLKQDYLFLFPIQDQSTAHIVWKSHLKQLSSITFSNNCQKHAAAFEVEGITYSKTWPWTYSHGPLISMHGSSGRLQVLLRVKSKLLSSSISHSWARYCQLIRQHAAGISEKRTCAKHKCSLLLYFGLYVLARIYPGYESPALLIPKLLVRAVNIFKLWVALVMVLTLRAAGLQDPC